MEEQQQPVAGVQQETETPNEVSLPGSKESSNEQPPVLQVLSQLNAPEENEKLTHQTHQEALENSQVNVEKSSQDIGQHNEYVNDIHEDDDVDDNDDHNSCSLKNLVSSSSNNDSLDKRLTNKLPIQIPTTKDCRPATDTESTTFKKEQEEKAKQVEVEVEDEEKLDGESSLGAKHNILDIESHLIETLNEIVPSEKSVGINELQPAEVELQVGCSKIETKDNVRSVIEVEPAELITKKQVEQILAKNDPLQAAQSEVPPTDYRNGESHVNQEEIEEVAKQLIQNIEDEVVKAFETNTFKGQDLLQTKETAEEAAEAEAGESKNRVEVGNLAEDQVDSVLVQTESKLSQVVDQQLSEVTSILESQTKITTDQLQVPQATQNLKLVTVPSPQTASEEAERKIFIDSLPALQAKDSTEAEKLALDCKKEYYQSLKKYLIQSSTDRPPRPLQTYRWEDLKRAKERGGYPWTHLYKRPLGPDEQPEIVLMLRKSQEIRFLSESPKSNKKVRIDDQVLIQETHPYLQELSEEEEEEEGHHSEHHLPTQDHENHSLHSESFSCVSDSVLATAKSKAANRFNKVRRLFRRRRYGARSNDDAQSLPDSFTNTSIQQSLEKVPQSQQQSQPAQPIYEHPKNPRCFPIMKKLKSMAERQKKRLNIKRIPLVKDDKVAPVPDEEPRIIRLKDSPKSQRSDIPHFVEKQDSDDVLEIVELDESPSRKRLGRQDNEENEENAKSSIVKPEEIIEISQVQSSSASPTNQEDEIHENSVQMDGDQDTDLSKPPKKTPRLRREHVYEEIDHPDDSTAAAAEELKFILDATSVEALKQSLATQDTSAVNEVAASKNAIPLDRMGSSEEEVTTTTTDRATPERKSNNYLLAPISSIDSASSDEDRTKTQLQPVTEEEQDDEEEVEETQHLCVKPQQELEAANDIRPSLKKESSPAPSDKKVTFSHVEDEADPHREDIELSPEQMEAAKEANKWKNTSK